MHASYLQRWTLVFALLSGAAGCSEYYTPPGRGADLQQISGEKSAVAGTITGSPDSSINTALAKKPLAQFPTAVAVVRVQATGYRSDTATGFGHGAFSVLTSRDVEEPQHIEKLAKLPGILGIAPLSRLLLPQDLQNDRDLREAAAKLHADMLLIYTLDTTFTVDDKALPLSVLTLGLSPNQFANVSCTASAILMDTRNGYIYGTAEHTAADRQLTSAWTSSAAVDDTRKRAEKAAFSGLVEDLAHTWAGVYGAYGRPHATERAAASE